jgi:hypothetical protein
MMLGYTLDIEAGDFCALHNAIGPYLERCKTEIAAGNTYPFKGDLARLEALAKRLMQSEEVVSRHVAGAIQLGDRHFEPHPRTRPDGSQDSPQRCGLR